MYNRGILWSLIYIYTYLQLITIYMYPEHFQRSYPYRRTSLDAIFCKIFKGGQKITLLEAARPSPFFTISITGLFSLEKNPFKILTPRSLALPLDRLQHLFFLSFKTFSKHQVQTPSVCCGTSVCVS